MGLYESLVRPAAFLLDPETAHDWAMRLIHRRFFRTRILQHPIFEQELFGKAFANPLGLAAGFDKNALGVRSWADLGFGFAEIGTVTMHAQPGNPKPRLFRLTDSQALINRLGFNNDGALAVAGRLAEAKPRIPMGINLGKSKITPLESAPSDYQKSFRLLRPFGDYFAVNVSSPNTPGLRSLQESGPLTEIIKAIQEVDSAKPLLIKIAPDLETSALDDVVQVAHDLGVAGLIATNTTVSREGIPSGARNREEEGGLSGAPLRDKSNAVLRHLYRACDKKMVLIGLGGVFNGQDLFDKLAFGAHLVQVYTGWVYRGPQMVPSSLLELVKLMSREGMKSLHELRGAKA